MSEPLSEPLSEHDSAEQLLLALHENKLLREAVAKQMKWRPERISEAVSDLQINRGLLERIIRYVLHRVMRYALYMGCFVSGVILVWLSITLEKNGHDYQLGAKFCEHLGVALIVAVVVAGVFHVVHETELIKRPLGEIESNIEKVRSETNDIAGVLRAKTQEIAETVAGFNNIMRFAQERGITSAFREGSDEWRKAILSVINDAEEFVYIEARTLRPFLTMWEEESTGWLGDAIRQKITANEKIYFAILLADVLDERSRYREELKLIFSTSEHQKNERGGCRAAVEWVLNLQQALKPPAPSASSSSPVSATTQTVAGHKPQIALRLLHDSPPVFLVMSEKSMIVGHYIPFKPIKCVRMLGISGGAELYNDYRDHFERFFAIALDPIPSMRRYIDRKRRDPDKDAKAEFERWQKNLAIAEMMHDLEPHMKDVVATRTRELTDRDFSATETHEHALFIDPAIIRTYRRGDNEFLEAIQEAFKEADSSFVYILGRCHSTMLGRGEIDAGTSYRKPPWLRALLSERMTNTSLTEAVTVILPDTFTKAPPGSGTGSYQSELNAIAKHRRLSGYDVSTGDLRNATRRTVDELLEMKISTKASEHALSIRLCRESPRACMLITGQRAFVELYVPGQDGGACRIIEVQNDGVGKNQGSGLYQAFKEYFETLRDASDTTDAVGLVQHYCNTHDSDYAHERQERLNRYYTIYPNARP